MQKIREIYFYKDHFNKFYASCDLKTKRKINLILDIVRFERRVPLKFLKYLKGTDGIYEIRISAVHGSIRLLSFFDKGDLIVVLNCFIKKSRKVPLNEINLAKKLKYEYFLAKRKV